MRLKVPEWPGFIFLFLPQPRGELRTCVNDIWNESSISEFSLKFEASAIRCSIPSTRPLPFNHSFAENHDNRRTSGLSHWTNGSKRDCFKGSGCEELVHVDSLALFLLFSIQHSNSACTLLIIISFHFISALTFRRVCKFCVQV